MTLTTPPAAGEAPPTVTRLRQSAPRWGEPAARRHGRPAHPGKLPVGTAFVFTLNENAQVTLTFIQIRRGHRTRQVGVLAVSGHAGANRVRFLGRLAHGRTLRPGRYRLLVIATSPAAQRSVPKQVTFTIVPERPTGAGR